MAKQTPKKIIKTKPKVLFPTKKEFQIMFKADFFTSDEYKKIFADFEAEDFRFIGLRAYEKLAKKLNLSKKYSTKERNELIAELFTYELTRVKDSITTKTKLKEKIEKLLLKTLSAMSLW